MKLLVPAVETLTRLSVPCSCHLNHTPKALMTLLNFDTTLQCQGWFQGLCLHWVLHSEGLCYNHLGNVVICKYTLHILVLLGSTLHTSSSNGSPTTHTLDSPKTLQGGKPIHASAVCLLPEAEKKNTYNLQFKSKIANIEIKICPCTRMTTAEI